MRKYVCGFIWTKWDGKRCCMELRWWMKINVVGIKKIFILFKKIIFLVQHKYLTYKDVCAVQTITEATTKGVLFSQKMFLILYDSAIPQALRWGGFSHVFISFLPNEFTFCVLLLNNILFHCFFWHRIKGLNHHSSLLWVSKDKKYLIFPRHGICGFEMKN